jgi:hypothetical protein
VEFCKNCAVLVQPTSKAFYGARPTFPWRYMDTHLHNFETYSSSATVASRAAASAHGR